MVESHTRKNIVFGYGTKDKKDKKTNTKKRHHSHSPSSCQKKTIKSMIKCHQKSMQGNLGLVFTEDQTDAFRVKPTSNDNAKELIMELCPELRHEIPDLDTYTTVADTGNWFAVVDPANMSQPLADATNVLAYRVDKAFNLDNEGSDNAALVAALRHFFATQPEMKLHHDPTARSSTAALHPGCWRWGKKPTWSGETTQKENINKAMDEMLAVVEERIGKRVAKLMKHHFPKLWKQREIVIERAYRSRALQRVLKKRPALRFSAWLTMAIKEGYSTEVHIDLNDDWNQLTCITTAGAYTGGAIVLPKQKVIVPFRTGQAFFLRSRNVPHYVLPYDGERFVLVGFMHHNLVRDAAKFFNNAQEKLYVISQA